MAISVKESQGRVLIEVDDLSLAKEKATELKTLALEAIKNGVRFLDIDLSRTEYIDSSGIGKLLFLNKKLKGTGGHLIIPRISPKLYEFLDSLAITRVIEITAP